MPLASSFFPGPWNGGVYFSKVASGENEADPKLTDYLDYFAGDPEAEEIMLYIEGFDRGNGRQLLDLTSQTSRKTPIVVLQSCRTRRGREVIRPRTGTTGGSPSALLRQCGITDPKSYAALFDSGLAFSGGRLPEGTAWSY